MTTKTEERNEEKKLERAAIRKRRQHTQDQKIERDNKLKAINDIYLPKIAKLREEHRAELNKVWKEWREERSTS